MTDLERALAAADAGLDASVARLCDFIAIPSVSTDPAHAADCRRAAGWLVGELAGIGMSASLRDTARHPMVVAHDAAGSGPHVLFYGHYDVQPPDPLDLWTTPPFEAQLLPQPNGDTWITGRGASDDKGQLLTFVEACRAWKTATGALPVRVSMLFEGEEEISSPSLGSFLDATAEELRADIVLVCDTDMWNRDIPAITTMMRGLVGEEITLTAADRDLHSGIFGNAARNALELLATVLGNIRDAQGHVTVPGFYDKVQELPEAIRATWARLPFDAAAFLGGVGLSEPAGEAGRSVLEQVWARPSFELHGLWGGFTGEGFKTVIPAQAQAKISFRLVAGQDPEAIRAAFRAHVRAALPPDVRVEFTTHGGSPATILPHDGALLHSALAGLADEWGDAAIAGTGGSIPILNAFRDRLGMDALLVGFARFDNRVHSPNEKYDLSSYHRGIRSWVRILDRFAKDHQTTG